METIPVVQGEVVRGEVVEGVQVEVSCCPSVLAAPLGEEQARELAHGFAALADSARLQILSILAASAVGEVCVCEFVEPLGKSQPTVSHHLKVLGEAGLVEGDRRGKWVWYRIVPNRLEALRAALASG
jgi:ArsR family transcriptional regulator, arsenate/arsenite/antimonite-responsive transcriptional repressor